LVTDLSVYTAHTLYSIYVWNVYPTICMLLIVRCIQTQSASLVCSTTGCTRLASDKYTGLCANCYVTAAVSPRDVNSRVAVATKQVFQVGGSGAPSCIMDFCSNVGSAECKGLCQECFSAVCQTRLQTASDPAITAITSAANRTSITHTVKLIVRY